MFTYTTYMECNILWVKHKEFVLSTSESTLLYL